MECHAKCVCAGPLGFCFEYAAFVEGGMVYTSEGCVAVFETELVRGFGESVDAASFGFGYSPPRRAKRG